MATAQNVKDKINSLISTGNAKTGKTDATMEDVVNTLISGYGQGGGITPTGTKNITTNGSHDVTNYATANVNVPVGITPSGSINITTNGTHNVTNYASALVNIVGLNARVYNITLSADQTTKTTFLTNDWLKSIRSNSKAFVFLVYLNAKPAQAQVCSTLTCNFPISYNATTVYNSIVIRSTATAGGTNSNTLGLTGTQYNGHLNIDANGGLFAYGNTNYPLKAGEYRIIAGLAETL